MKTWGLIALSMVVFGCGQNPNITSRDRSVQKPVVVQQGPQGSQGCGLRPFVVEMPARPLTDQETSTLVLPYRSTPLHKIPTLQIGEMTGYTASGLSFVSNSQVVFGFDLRLPPRAQVTQVNRIAIELSVLKYSTDAYPQTEMICFPDSRVCSGHHYLPQEGSWMRNLNPGFWDKSKDTANTAFSDALEQEKRTSDLWSDEAMTLTFDELLHGSAAQDSLQFLYDSGETLRVVVADDTDVKSARLVVDLEQDTCIQSAPSQQLGH